MTPYEELEAKFDHSQRQLNAYRKHVNMIDDFFEYSNQSESDRRFIHGILGSLCATLLEIP